MTHQTSTDFSDLAASAAVFSSATAAPTLSRQLDGIPRLTRTLQQVSDTSLDALRSRPGASDASDGVHSSALRLLAQRGFAAERLRCSIADISERSPFVTRSARHRQVDGDASQLLHIQRQAVASRAADEARLKANARFRSRFTATMAEDLSIACAQLVSRIDEAPRTHSAATTPLSSQTPDLLQRTPRTPYTTPRVARTPYSKVRTPRTGPAPLCAVEDDYLSVIRSLLLEGDAPSVASLMHETASCKSENPHLREILAVLANLASFVSTESPPLYARVFAARTVLEDQFAERSGVLPVKPRQAAPIAIQNDVRNFVEMLMDRNELAHTGENPHMLGGVPLWAQVYYCFRVGNLEAALTVLEAAKEGNHEVGNYVALLDRFLRVKRDPAFDADTRKYVVGSLSNIHEFNALLEEYRTVVWHSGDVYYRACYMLLARLELAPSSPKVKDASESAAYPLQPPHHRTHVPFPDSDFNELFASVEDYMWMRLFQSRTALEEGIIRKLPEYQFVEFSQIQREIQACGSAHFDPQGNHPFLFAFVLTCAGLYWDAAKFLSNTNDELCLAGGAHVAIVLHMLQWTEDDCDVGEILWSYVSNFARTQPAEAVAYLFTIRHRERLLHWLHTLIQETREYAALLGTSTDESDYGAIQDTFSRMPDNFPVVSLEDLSDLRRTAARRAAVFAQEQQNFHQAAELFALSGDRQTSWRMLLQGLAVVVDARGGPNRSLAISQGRRALKVIVDGGETGPIPRSLDVLLTMASFFDEYNAGRLSSAWAVLTSMHFLPLTEDQILARRSDLLPSSSRFEPVVSDQVAAVLRATLDICEHALLSGKVQSERTPSSQFRRQVKRLPTRLQIKSLITFSGLIGMAETEVNASLVRIELLLA